MTLGPLFLETICFGITSPKLMCVGLGFLDFLVGGGLVGTDSSLGRFIIEVGFFSTTVASGLPHAEARTGIAGALEGAGDGCAAVSC